MTKYASTSKIPIQTEFNIKSTGHPQILIMSEILKRKRKKHRDTKNGCFWSMVLLRPKCIFSLYGTHNLHNSLGKSALGSSELKILVDTGCFKNVGESLL